MSDVISTPYKQECVSQYDCVLFNYRTKNMCFKRKKRINMKTAISYGRLFFKISVCFNFKNIKTVSGLKTH